MSLSKVLTAALSVFILVTVVTLVAKNMRPGARETAAGAASSERSSTSASGKDRVIVYCFHGKTRCPTCDLIENLTHDVVKSRFAEQLKDGSVEWRVVDFDSPGNEHFAKDYDLVATSVVVVQMRDGAQKSWKNLQEVWALVGDKQALGTMIEQEIRRLL